MNFSRRVYEKELLDRDDIPMADILQNMKELNTINHLLGGHAITIRGLTQILSATTSTRRNPVHIVEIGCGGGDNLRVLQSYCIKHSIAAEFTGIDINQHCIAFASKEEKMAAIRYIHSDYKTVTFHNKPDIIFSSLFCHHFTEPDLLFMVKWMYQNTRLGFFINDLQRHLLAYYSISVLTRLFSNSYLVKNDAPLSVRRGFRKEELLSLLQQAGISQGTVSWQWAFRYLAIAIHPPNEHDKL